MPSDTQQPFHAVNSAVANPIYHRNELFPAYENYHSPRIHQLRQQYRLDDVVQGQSNEWQRILLLRQWVSQALRVDNHHATSAELDVFALLDAAQQGDGFHCAHYSVVLHAVLNSFGHVTRRLGCGPGVEGLDGFHGSNEVWVNSLCKWVVVDAKYDKHFERQGVPLSALEIRDQVIHDGGQAVRDCYGPARAGTGERADMDFACQAQTYRWIDWELSTNFFTSYPNTASSMQVLYEDQYARTHTWWRDGKRNWIIGSSHAIMTTNRHWIEWTPNVIGSHVTPSGTSALIRLESFTPNLRSYQMRRGCEWQDCPHVLQVDPAETGDAYTFRTMSLFGVSGPEHTVRIA